MRHLPSLLLAATAFTPLGLMPQAFGNPLGAAVVAGAATVVGEGTTDLTVDQATAKAIIDWQSFDIGSGEITQFVQPSASSVTLNRVTGNEGPSQILGTLKANGQLFVVNPDGIVFGQDARVDVNGLVATTSNVTNADFLSGHYSFSQPGSPYASVVNLGTITAAEGGFAALVGPGVRNAGTITANLGKVSLTSADTFTLDFYGDNLINLAVDDTTAENIVDVSTGRKLSNLVDNSGLLKADGGTVQLSAAAARAVVNSVINNTGNIEANSVGIKNGKIILSAATDSTKPAGLPAQKVVVSGTLSATGKNRGELGGKVEITGEQIALAEATIDAFGWNGGGSVLVGGDVGGGSPNPAVANLAAARLDAQSVPNATTVSMDTASLIDASATYDGDGGKVVLWSDDLTTFSGMIEAGGGRTSGDGGFVETSGRQNLVFDGSADLRGPGGQTGTLLLDPQDVVIAVTGNVTPAAIENNLATSNVIVTTSTGIGADAGDITVGDPISWNSVNSLTLNADRNITVDAAITSTGGAAINLRADDQGSGTGTVTFGGAGVLSTAGQASIYYDPSDNPAGAVVNSTSYAGPIENYSGDITGGGVVTAYMLVNSIYDLQNVENNLGGDYALGRNIDASQIDAWNAGVGFIPIGYSSATTTNHWALTLTGINATPGQFIGVLDGLGHTVSGLTINNQTADNLGLFSWVGTAGVVRDLNLSDASVTGGSDQTNVAVVAAVDFGTIDDVNVSGTLTVGDNANKVGGVVGWLWNGTIENSTSGVNVKGGNANDGIGGLVGEGGFSGGGTISNSSDSGSITVGDNATSIGGLVGGNNGSSIYDSYATGDVDAGADSSSVGGLAGSSSGFWSTGLIDQSYATGDVAVGAGSTSTGGLVGNNLWHATISNSYARGSVTGDRAVGGLVGWNGYGDVNQPIPATISSSYSTGSVSGTTDVGALVGYNNGGGAISGYWDSDNTGALPGLGYPSGDVGWNAVGLSTAALEALPTGFDPSIWATKSGINGSYPYLLWQTSTTPSMPPVTLAPSPPVTSPPTEYVESGTGVILQLADIAGHSFPHGTYFVDESTGIQYTAEQLGGTTLPPANSTPSTNPEFLPIVSWPPSSSRLSSIPIDATMAGSTSPACATGCQIPPAVESMASVLANHFIESFSSGGLSKDTLTQAIATLLVAALPKEFLGSDAAVQQLQDFLVNDLDETLYESASTGTVASLLEDRVMGALAGSLADGVGHVLVVNYGFSENSIVVISAELATDMAIQSSYGLTKRGPFGALLGATQAAVGEVIDATVKTQQTLGAADSALEQEKAYEQELRALAAKIDNPIESGRLLLLAEQGALERSSVTDTLNDDVAIRILVWFHLAKVDK